MFCSKKIKALNLFVSIFYLQHWKSKIEQSFFFSSWMFFFDAFFSLFKFFFFGFKTFFLLLEFSFLARVVFFLACLCFSFVWVLGLINLGGGPPAERGVVSWVTGCSPPLACPPHPDIISLHPSYLLLNAIASQTNQPLDKLTSQLNIHPFLLLMAWFFPVCKSR